MSRLTRAVAIAAAALTLGPAAAEARPTAADAVAQHLQRSERALDKVARAIADGDARRTRAALRQSRDRKSVV